MASPTASANAAHATAAASDGLAGAYYDVHAVDPFARGRVANFIRRMGRVEGEIFHVKELPAAQDSSGAAAATEHTRPLLFIATCRVPLPEPHLSYLAEGVAEDRKEAELLAAMHAERVCDALGVPLFRLKTAQQKHAETVRQKEGRYAPFPGDPVKPLGTPVPPPLRLLRSQPSSSSSSSSSQHSATTTPVQETAQATQSNATITQASAVSQEKRPVSQDAASAATVPPPHRIRDMGADKDVRGEGNAKNTNDADHERPASAKMHSNDTASPSLCGDEESALAEEMWRMWPTAHATTFLARHPSLNVSRRHDPRRLYAAHVPYFTNAEHAERVRAYASTVVYPWQNNWEEAFEGFHGGIHVRAALNSGGNGKSGGTHVHSAGLAAAAAAVTNVNFDPTENGLWQMVNDRNLRCSPTPDDALVLPYVFDGPHALERMTAYYQQHGTTLHEHVQVRSVATPGSTQRMMEAELRLVGVNVTARGKSQTEEMAVRLAAMHGELLLDALGLPLFPKDGARQARHAAAVAGYGRWATDPLNGSTTSPNPHDALPRPLKSQVGTDDVWLSPSASPQMRQRRTEAEHIIAAHNFLVSQSEDMIEVNPPAELLQEAYAMLREWQTHIARNRYTNLYVLFDMDNGVFRATTLTPVPARFGLRGGTAVGLSPESAMQLCALHAFDTLCALGVPLCVDAEQERRYLQRRAALGQTLPQSLTGVAQLKSAIIPRSVSNGGLATLRDVENGSELGGGAGTQSGDSAAASASAEVSVPYLPSYMLEGQQVRLPPLLADTVHVMQLRVPQDFCLFSGGKDSILSDVGNEVKVCVQNYLAHCVDVQLREMENVVGPLCSSTPKYPPTPHDFSVQPSPATVPVSAAAAVTTATATAPPPTTKLADDEILRTQVWASQYLRNAPPSAFITGYSTLTSVHSVAYLQLPLPSPALLQACSSTPDVIATAAALAVKSTDGLPQNPAYVLAVGISLKRKDALRACYLHAAAILNALGLDVLSAFSRNTPRHRLVPNFAALKQYLGTEAVVVIPPFTPDGQRNTQPLSSSRGTGDAGGPVDSRLEGARRAPRAVLHNILKTFLEDPRHATPPKRRPQPRGVGPFTPAQRYRG